MANDGTIGTTLDEGHAAGKPKGLWRFFVYSLIRIFTQRVALTLLIASPIAFLMVGR